MKFKNLFISLGLVLSVGAGIGTALSAKENVKEAKAATAKNIYVDIDLNTKFQENNATPQIHYWDGSHDVDVPLNHVSNNIYVTASTIPASVFANGRGFEVFCWGNKQTQNNNCCSTWIAGDGVLQYNNYNYLCLNADPGSGHNVGIKGFGYYGSKTVNPGASADTQRVWLKNDTPYFYGNDDWGIECKNTIGYLYNSTWYEIVMPAVLNARNSNYYFYADIPSTVTSVHFMRKAQATNHNYLTYLDGYVETLTYGKCYYSGSANYDDFVNLSAGTVAAADEALLSAVLGAYVVCTDTASNGANQTTVRNIYSAWIEHKHDDTDMDTTFKDYVNGAYTEHGNSYAGQSKTADWKLSEKWEALCKAANVNPTTGAALSKMPVAIVSNEIDNTLIIIIASSVVTLLAIGGYFYLRKRKEDR